MAHDYDQHRESMAERSRTRSEAGREIGPLPAIADPERRARGAESLRAFCVEYFPGRFTLAFGKPHLAAIERLESCTDEGGLFALAFQRGGGKTTLTEVAAIRALLYGLRRFCVIVQASEKLSAKSLKKIQRELETNELLAADFPEAIYPIRRLERIHNRARGQTLDGRPTRIEWTADSVTFPTVTGSPSSGAILHCAGITGSIKGLSAMGPAGEILRPDLLILDDCQTRESAKSPTQTGEREAIIMDDLLGLAGPESTIAAVFLCTPIYECDLSERFLDHEHHPEWGGVRTRMLESFPSRMDLWDQYAEIRRDEQSAGGRGKRSNEFYRQHRSDMDDGADVSWPERKRNDEISGLQCAMNLYYRNPAGFHAEYNCTPQSGRASADAKEFVAAAVASRFTGIARLIVPGNTTFLTCYLDPGVYVAWWVTVAWNAAFGGQVIDYGVWPRQARTNFRARDAGRTLRQMYPNHSDKELVFASTRDILAEVLPRTYFRDGDSEPLMISRAGVDSGFQPDAVAQAIQRSTARAILVCGKGWARSMKARRSINEWPERDGERKGDNWRLNSGGKMVIFDSDYWKSHVHDRMTLPAGGPRALTLYGSDAYEHAMFAEHCAAEVASTVEIEGTRFAKWNKKPLDPDAHLFDCLVGCAVMASLLGLRISADAKSLNAQAQPRKPVKLSDLARQKTNYGHAGPSRENRRVDRDRRR